MKVLVNPIYKIEEQFNSENCRHRIEPLHDSLSNINQVFIKCYVNYVYHIKGNRYVEDLTTDIMLGKILNGSFNWNTPHYQEYAQWESENLKQYDTDKERDYLDFLEKNNYNFFILDQLHSEFKLDIYTGTSFISESFNSRLYSLNTQHFAKELNKYSRFLLEWSRYTLLTSFDLYKSSHYNFISSQIFNLKNLTRKLESSSYENQENALHLIKSYINKASDNFYAASEITDMIAPHAFILDEIEDRLNKIRVSSQELIDLSAEILNEHTANFPDNQLENVDYPKHIFTNKQAYLLFHTIATEMNKHAQLSFLFRQMSEAENPQLIMCRDAVFREWFNEQEYNLELEYVTKRLTDVSTEDRQTFYALAKKLLNINN
jgi:hypothetical protein